MAANALDAGRHTRQGSDPIDFILGGELNQIEQSAPKLRLSTSRIDPHTRPVLQYLQRAPATIYIGLTGVPIYGVRFTSPDQSLR